MINTEEIYRNEFLSVHVDKENKVLFWEWTSKDQEFSNTEFLEHCHILLDFVIEHNCRFLIENAINSRFKISIELQEQFANEILVHLNGLVNKMAVINSSEIITALSNEQWYDEVENKSFNDRYFSSKEEAINWIYKDL